MLYSTERRGRISVLAVLAVLLGSAHQGEVHAGGEGRGVRAVSPRGRPAAGRDAHPARRAVARSPARARLGRTRAARTTANRARAARATANRARAARATVRPASLERVRLSALRRRSIASLRASTVRTDHGRFTTAAPKQYPHQWSWDSAFIAMGLAHVDPRRAAEELTSLFAAQWPSGKVPHIVYNRRAPRDSYFPDPARWRSPAATASRRPPPGIDSSGLINPPVHAIAALEVYRAASRGGPAARAAARRQLVELYPKLVSWHRYLLTERDPEGSGLVTILHPWESGMDNSPRWDAPLSRVQVDNQRLPPYQRRDRTNAAAESRPSDAHYDQFMWLVELYKESGYDDGAVQRPGAYPFRVKDVFMSAMLVRANESLLEIARIVRAPAADRAVIAGWRDRGRRGLERRWDPELGGMTDLDLVSGQPIRVRTVANFAGLVAGRLSPEKRAAQLALLDSKHFAGHPGLARKLPPSTSPSERSYDPKNYWRGPSWPIMNWILWRALRENGAPGRAERLRRDSLDQIARRGAAEYFDARNDTPYGSMADGRPAQSWTHAFVLAATGPAPAPSRAAPPSRR